MAPKERWEVPALFKTGLARPYLSAVVPKERWEVPALFQTGLARPYLSARALIQLCLQKQKGSGSVGEQREACTACAGVRALARRVRRAHDREDTWHVTYRMICH